jgi:hypothetical protein
VLGLYKIEIKHILTYMPEPKLALAFTLALRVVILPEAELLIPIEK